MKFAVPISRFLVTVPTLTLLAGGAAPAENRGTSVVTVTVSSDSAAASSQGKDSPPPVTLAPEVEKKLQVLFDKITAKKDAYWDAQMKREIDEIAKTVTLSDAQRQALDAAAKKAVAASTGTVGSSDDGFRRRLASMPPDRALVMLDQALVQINRMTNFSESDSSTVEPPAQDCWTQALHQTLTPAQADAWNKLETQKQDAADKEIAGVLKSGADRTHDEQTNEVQTECKNIETSLHLPKDRAAALDALGATVVSQTVELWRKREEKYLRAMPEPQRRQILGNRFYMGVGPGESPTQTAVWTDGLAHLLTADERARLEQARDGRKLKRQHAMGGIMILLLDEKVALTAAQRDKLQPIAERLVKDIPELYPPDNPGAYYGINPSSFYAAAAKVGDAELKPILDPAQLKRWRALPKSAFPSETLAGAAAAADSTSGHDAEPEDVEKTVSAFLYEKTEGERERTLLTNTLRAEDIARVTGLNAEETDRLQAAARGATEQYLTTWKWFTEQQIRSQLQGLTPQNVRQRLDGLQDYFFQRNFGTFNQQNIWDSTVQTVLTAQQQDAWQKEIYARDAYRGNAIAALVLCEFDRRTHLTDDQWSRLQPLIAGVVSDYSAGIAQVFSNMNGSPWYLSGPYMLIPFAGIDDKDLQLILSKDQFNLWTGSADYGSANSLWQVIKQMHVQQGRQHARAVIED